MVNLKYCNVRSLEGGVDMHALLVTLLVIVCIGLIAVVLLQSGRSAGLSGAITGGAEQLFGKQKARGIDAVLHRVTVVLAVLFFVLTIAVTYFQL
jgi:preprotein translocase subunit SecG